MIAAIAIVLTSTAARAEWPLPQAAYSAEGTMEAAGMRIPYKVYHDHGKERRIMTMEGMEQVTISRPDKGVIYMVMPGMNMAMEMPMGAGRGVPQSNQMAAYSPKAVGQETISGIETTKYRIDGGETGANAMTGFAWATADGIMVRMEATSQEGKIVFSLENLVRGPQDPALFELPDGVQIMQGSAMPQQ
jgi:hypothetical protein